MLTCIALGSAIGLIVMAILSSPFVSATHTLLQPEYWFFAYLIGFPFAFASGGLFMMITTKFKWNGLLSSILAALIPIAVCAMWFLLEDYSKGHGFRWSSIAGVPNLAIVGVIAVTGCWLLARALRIVK